MKESTKTSLKKVRRYIVFIILCMLIGIFGLTSLLIYFAVTEPTGSAPVYDFGTQQTAHIATGMGDVGIITVALMSFSLPFQLFFFFFILSVQYPNKKIFSYMWILFCCASLISLIWFVNIMTMYR